MSAVINSSRFSTNTGNTFLLVKNESVVARAMNSCDEEKNKPAKQVSPAHPGLGLFEMCQWQRRRLLQSFQRKTGRGVEHTRML